MKQTQYGLSTYNSPSFIRRMTHNLRLKRSIKALSLKENDVILDYGAGDGYLAKLLYKSNHKYITCYEPMKEQYDQMTYLLSDMSKIRKIDNIKTLSNNSYQKNFCLEVMEHLPKRELDMAIETLYQLLDEDGKVLLTVPCESGINGILKNCIKKTIDKNKTYSYKDIWMIAFNKKRLNV